MGCTEELPKSLAINGVLDNEKIADLLKFYRFLFILIDNLIHFSNVTFI